VSTKAGLNPEAPPVAQLAKSRHVVDLRRDGCNADGGRERATDTECQCFPRTERFSGILMPRSGMKLPLARESGGATQRRHDACSHRARASRWLRGGVCFPRKGRHTSLVGSRRIRERKRDCMRGGRLNYELRGLHVGLLGRPDVEAALEAHERFPSCLELHGSEPLSDLLCPFDLSGLDLNRSGDFGGVFY